MSEKKEPRITDSGFGFAWGPLGVERRTTTPDGGVVLGLVTDAGVDVDVYVSPAGRSVRIVTKDERVRLLGPTAGVGGAQ